MSGATERSYPVVRLSHKGKLLQTVACTTQAEAEKAEQELLAKDPRGWYADSEIRPMTMSELAYELSGQ